MKIFLILAMASCALSAFASSYASFAIGSEEQKPVAVGLLRKADHVAVSVILSSDQRDSEVRNDEVNRARRWIIQEADKNDRITARIGSATLNFRDSSKLSSYPANDSKATVILYYALGTNSIYQANQQLKQFVKGLKLSDRIAIAISDTKLAVESPEKYRGEVLSKIRLHAQESAELLGHGTYQIHGLENPVLVRQVDEENVELYLKYQMSVKKE